MFWEKGFDGASIKDLTRAMGIRGPSLYAAFGDKQGLFLRAIDRYAASAGCGPLVAFEEEAEIGAAVRAFLQAVVDHATLQPSGVRGCFLTACVATSAGVVEGVDRRLREAIRSTDLRLAGRFEAETAAGRLPAEFPALERARLLFDLRQGLMLRARAGIDRETLLADLDQRVAMVLL